MMDTSKDISELYIKMCYCEEIQNHPLAFTTCGDVTNKGIVRAMAMYHGETTYTLKVNDGNYFNQKDLIWLPLQGQLQKMLPHRFPHEIVQPWYDFCFVTAREYKKGILSSMCSHFETMEQLWLVFVMHVKFNKIWYDETWRCQNDEH